MNVKFYTRCEVGTTANKAIKIIMCWYNSNLKVVWILELAVKLEFIRNKLFRSRSNKLLEDWKLSAMALTFCFFFVFLIFLNCWIFLLTLDQIAHAIKAIWNLSVQLPNVFLHKFIFIMNNKIKDEFGLRLFGNLNC